MSRHYSWTRLYHAVLNEDEESLHHAIFCLHKSIHTTVLHQEKNALLLSAHLGKIRSLNILIETLDLVQDNERFRIVSDIMKTACRNGQYGVLKSVLDSPYVPIRHDKNEDSWESYLLDDLVKHCLHDATRHGNIEIVNLILRRFYQSSKYLEKAKRDIVYLIFQYGHGPRFIENLDYDIAPIVQTCNPFYQAMLYSDWTAIRKLINEDTNWHLHVLDPPRQTSSLLVDLERLTTDNSVARRAYRRQNFNIFQYATVRNDKEMLAFLLSKAEENELEIGDLLEEACDLAFERGKLEILHVLETRINLNHSKVNFYRLLKSIEAGRTDTCSYFVKRYYIENSANCTELSKILSPVVASGDLKLLDLVLDVLEKSGSNQDFLEKSGSNQDFLEKSGNDHNFLEKSGNGHDFLEKSGSNQDYSEKALRDALMHGLPGTVEYIVDKYNPTLRGEECWCSVMVHAWLASAVCVETLGPFCSYCQNHVLISLLYQRMLRLDLVMPYLLTQHKQIENLNINLRSQSLYHYNTLRTVISVQDFVDKPLLDVILMCDHILDFRTMTPTSVFWDFYNLYHVCTFFKLCCGSSESRISWYGLLAAGQNLPRHHRDILRKAIIMSGIRVTDPALLDDKINNDSADFININTTSRLYLHYTNRRRTKSEKELSRVEMLRLSQFPSPKELSLKGRCRIAVRKGVRSLYPDQSLQDAILDLAVKKVIPKSIATYLLFREEQRSWESLMDVICQVYRNVASESNDQGLNIVPSAST